MPIYTNGFHWMEFGVPNCAAKDGVNTKSCDWGRATWVDGWQNGRRTGRISLNWIVQFNFQSWTLISWWEEMNFDGFNVISQSDWLTQSEWSNVKSKTGTSAESWTKFIKLSTTTLGAIHFLPKMDLTTPQPHFWIIILLQMKANKYNWKLKCQTSHQNNR